MFLCILCMLLMLTAGLGIRKIIYIIISSEMPSYNLKLSKKFYIYFRVTLEFTTASHMYALHQYYCCNDLKLFPYFLYINLGSKDQSTCKCTH